MAIWRRAPGSSLDPENADGPLPFTSAAFLALAFARIHIDIGPHRLLRSRDPEQIAAALLDVQAPTRGRYLTKALLHATHALSLPVRDGIDYAARRQMAFWSCQHCLCGLETGVFLWKWLETLHVASQNEPFGEVSCPLFLVIQANFSHCRSYVGRRKQSHRLAAERRRRGAGIHRCKLPRGGQPERPRVGLQGAGCVRFETVEPCVHWQQHVGYDA